MKFPLPEPVNEYAMKTALHILADETDFVEWCEQRFSGDETDTLLYLFRAIGGDQEIKLVDES